MLDYKDIITKHYALGMSGMAIAKSLEVSVSGVNDFLRAFKECKTLGYPLPQGITNYGIAEAVYGKSPGGAGRDLSDLERRGCRQRHFEEGDPALHRSD